MPHHMQSAAEAERFSSSKRLASVLLNVVNSFSKFCCDTVHFVMIQALRENQLRLTRSRGKCV